MKILLMILLTISLYANECLVTTQFGFIERGNLLTSFKEGKEALRTWLYKIAESKNCKINVRFYKDMDILYSKLKSNDLDMAVFSPRFFFKDHEGIKNFSNHFWSLAKKKEKRIQYYFIGWKNTEIKDFKGIKNKIISVERASKPAFIWLDKNSLIENKKTYKKVVKTIKYEQKDSRVLLDVFFKKVDLGIVKKSTWDTMIELNPAILKRIKIIKK